MSSSAPSTRDSHRSVSAASSGTNTRSSPTTASTASKTQPKIGHSRRPAPARAPAPPPDFPAFLLSPPLRAFVPPWGIFSSPTVATVPECPTGERGSGSGRGWGGEKVMRVASASPAMVSQQMRDLTQNPLRGDDSGEGEQEPDLVPDRVVLDISLLRARLPLDGLDGGEHLVDLVVGAARELRRRLEELLVLPGVPQLQGRHRHLERAEREPLRLRADPQVVQSQPVRRDRPVVGALALHRVEREFHAGRPLVLRGPRVVVDRDGALGGRLHLRVEDARLHVDGVAEAVGQLVRRDHVPGRLPQEAARGAEPYDLAPEPVEVLVVDARAPAPRVVDAAEEGAPLPVVHEREDDEPGLLDGMEAFRMA